MPKIPNVFRAFRLTAIATLLFTAGCGSSQSSSLTGTIEKTVTLTPVTLLNSIVNAIQKPVSKAMSGWEIGSYVDEFKSMLSGSQYTIVMHKISYQSTGADGKSHAMTGLLILPQSILGSRPSVPIMMYQHGTEPYRPYSPSRFLNNMDSPGDYPEVMVAAAIASNGYAVAMTDYEGLGDNTDTQPYVHGATLAKQVIDMLRASRDIIAGNDSPCKWNSQLFLMGYSEGGYVTMTTTRELQRNYAGEFTVTASAPLSGPHDLSGAMRSLILSDNTFKAPYFLPFLLTGYSYASGGALFNPSSAMVSPYNATVSALFDGNTPSDKINEALGMSYSEPKLIVPKSLLTQQFIDQLSSDDSPVVVYLKANDSYRGWTPTVPIRMYHHVNDDLVPFANSRTAFNAFSSAGAKYHGVKPQVSGVELVEVKTAVTPSSDPAKSIHLAVALSELSEGLKWIESFRK